MVKVEELRKWRYAEPFRPFEVVLDDGRRALIKHPWNIGWSAESEKLAFASGHDDVDIVSFARVVSLGTPTRRRKRATAKRPRKGGRA